MEIRAVYRAPIVQIQKLAAPDAGAGTSSKGDLHDKFIAAKKNDVRSANHTPFSWGMPRLIASKAESTSHFGPRQSPVFEIF